MDLGSTASVHSQVGKGHHSDELKVTDELYCYPPDYTFLRNKLGIRDADVLNQVERRISADRIAVGCPEGSFDLNHLRAIHDHIFRDIYDWAGQLRTVEISKNGTQFIPRQFIETGMADVHRRIVNGNHLKSLSPDMFAAEAAEIIGDINHIHPFREGNGRVQLQYLSQLASQADHRLDLRKIEPRSWIEASITSHHGDYSMMRDCIRGCIGERDRAAEIALRLAQARKRSQDRER